MSTKHTRGPWEVNKTRYGSIWIGGAEIADTGFQTEIASVCSEYGEMSRANAALIAAGPDLLAALKQCLEDDAGDLEPATVHAAMQAIAKAEGLS